MKSARILVAASLVLLMGYGVSVTLRAWGQQPATATSSGSPLANFTTTYNNPGQTWINVKSNDPEMDKVVLLERAAERDVAELIGSYSRAEKDAERSKIKSDLAAALKKEFDLQQQRRELELTRAEDRLKKVRELMKKRSDARESIIGKRLDQLVSEAEGLGWTPPAGINLPRNGSANRPLDSGAYQAK